MSIQFPNPTYKKAAKEEKKKKKKLQTMSLYNLTLMISFQFDPTFVFRSPLLVLILRTDNETGFSMTDTLMLFQTSGLEGS